MNKKNKKNKIIIFTDLNRGSFLLAKKIKLFYLDDDVKILFYSEETNIFFDGDLKIDSLKSYLLNTDFVFNLLSPKYNKSHKLGKELKSLNIPVLSNSMETKILFFKKSNLKNLFKKFDIESPAFISLKNKVAEEAFASFPQPSRIFSKSNKYFSEKIDNIEKMKKVYKDIGGNAREYLIEEYIDGNSVYSLVVKKENTLLVHSLFETDVSLEINTKVSDLSKKVFNDFKIDKFALIHWKVDKKEKVFILNIFTELDILIGEKEAILKRVFKKEGISTEYFFQILEENLKNQENKNILLKRL